MRLKFAVCAVMLFASLSSCWAQANELHERRNRAAASFSDGILLLHARSSIDLAADGFRQDPIFYYYTGVEDIAGALLAIDGRSRESWLFLPSQDPFVDPDLRPEVSPGPESAKQLEIDHVVDWSELESFLAAPPVSSPKIFF